jgi:hypothetical protein
MSHDPTVSKALEFQIFKNPMWSFFYIFSVAIFMIHACLGWKKVTPVLGIPRGHIQRVEILGFLDRSDRDSGMAGNKIGAVDIGLKCFFLIGLSWIKIDFCFSFFWGRPKVDFSGTPWPCRIAIKVDFIAMESIATRKTVPVLGAQWTKFGGKPSITFPCRQWWLSLSHDLSLAQKSFAAYSNTDP